MPKAVIVTLADEVTEILNAKAGSWSQSFVAQRMYQPKRELEDTDTLRVTTAIAAWRVAPDNRAEWSNEFDIDIGIQFRAGPKSGDQATNKFDELLLLVQQITDYFEDNRPPIAACPLTEIQYGGPAGAPYVPEHIEKLTQFTSVIRLTFTKWRDPDA